MIELQTIDGIKTVDLSTISLDDVNKIISRLSVETNTVATTPTILYSGNISGHKASDIVKAMDDVRIIDNTSG